MFSDVEEPEIEEQSTTYEFNCSIVREFLPDEQLTGIPLAKDEKLEMIVGYKAYRSPSWNNPSVYDSNTTTWTVIESESLAYSVIALGSTIAITLISILSL